MNDDDTAPAWAGALLQAMNDRFDQVDTRLDKLGGRLSRIADKTEQAADELQQTDEAMARILARMTGRTPEGRGD